jgi:hypothetical protein
LGLGIQLEYIGEIKVYPTADASNRTGQAVTFLSMKEIVAVPGHLYKKPLSFAFQFGSPIAQAHRKILQRGEVSTPTACISSPPRIPSLPSPAPSSLEAKKIGEDEAMLSRSLPSFIESFYGHIVQCRYYLRCTIFRKTPFQANWLKDYDIFIMNNVAPPPLQTSFIHYVFDKIDMQPMQLEFGLDHYLHVKLHLPKTVFSLQQSTGTALQHKAMLVIEGALLFLMVRIALIDIDVQFFMKEMVRYNDGKTYIYHHLIHQSQIMEGSPGTSDTMPFRLLIQPLVTRQNLLKLIKGEKMDPLPTVLSPTLNQVHQRFSTRYYLNFILTDYERKKYFKQQEIYIVP